MPNNSIARFQSIPGIVDIMPTLNRHLYIALPKEQTFEINGVPFVGSLSVNQLVASKRGDNFKEGERDSYRLLGEVANEAQKAEFDLGKILSLFYKLVLEGERNRLHSWIVYSKATTGQRP